MHRSIRMFWHSRMHGFQYFQFHTFTYNQYIIMYLKLLDSKYLNLPQRVYRLSVHTLKVTWSCPIGGYKFHQIEFFFIYFIKSVIFNQHAGRCGHTEAQLACAVSDTQNWFSIKKKADHTGLCRVAGWISRSPSKSQNLVRNSHGLRTPNEGINQRYLKNWAYVADKICFGRT